MGWSQPVTTVVTLVIVAAVTGVIVSTTGQTAAQERDVLGRIDDAGTRTIVVEDTKGDAHLDPGLVERVSGLSGVEWAVGFGIATDVRPPDLPSAPAVAIRALYGTLPPDLVATTDWGHQPHTALAGPQALRTLGFPVAAGPVQPSGGGPLVGVVGWLQAQPPLDFLNRSLLTTPQPGDQLLRVFALAHSPQQVAALANAIANLADPDDPTSLAVTTSDTLVQVRSAVQGELGRYGRNLVALILAAGLVLAALNIYGSVTTRRRDFGRRRALGASRPDIITLITAQTATTALLGASLGAAAGGLIVNRVLHITPDVDFSVAAATLAVITTTLAALPPALIAAYRDPVRILRVP